jgi:hypothetical protein
MDRAKHRPMLPGNAGVGLFHVKQDTFRLSRTNVPPPGKCDHQERSGTTEPRPPGRGCPHRGRHEGCGPCSSCKLYRLSGRRHRPGPGQWPRSTGPARRGPPGPGGTQSNRRGRPGRSQGASSPRDLVILSVWGLRRRAAAVHPGSRPARRSPLCAGVNSSRDGSCRAADDTHLRLTGRATQGCANTSKDAPY